MRLRVLERIDDVAAAAWDALVPPGASPCLEHGYLAALELSGSLRRQQLEARHLTLWSGDRLVAAAPAYLKRSDAYDQMVDWGHELAKRHELAYHPMVVIAVPLAREGAARFLTAPELDRDEAIRRLVAGARELASGVEHPVVHVWSCTEDEAAALGRLGFCRRIAPWYAWSNAGYASFEDFLARLRKKRRTEIRRERRAIAEAGITVRTLRGEGLSAEVVDLMWRCHRRTVEKYAGGSDLLEPDFLALLAARLGHRMEVYVAEHAGRPVAAMFGLTNAAMLAPKQWGAIEELPLTHFAVLYHVMEQAIARGIPLVDTGGPGEHKELRGCVPDRYRHGAIWVGDDELFDAVRRLVEREHGALEREIAGSLARSPFRRDGT